MCERDQESKLVDTAYKSDRYQLYIKVDEALKVLVACDYVLGEMYRATCGRLKEVSSDLAQELENYFSIKLIEYGVETKESTSLIYIPGE
ncbi:hypothetical protein JHD46_05260 [Sulfurimonas sp. SAG-AH-194-C20]|nr:hypothetical protein [Sulfurimonas sp. SAG-AH-194-C20]MDF1879047.1 hypothetical protein [Sulfurimonas sp. SAG-AH-194-C20]